MVLTWGLERTRRVSLNVSSFTPADAHFVVYSEHVFYAQCLSRGKERIEYKYETFLDLNWTEERDSVRVRTYDQNSESIVGFLKEADTRNRPSFEGWGLSDQLLFAEMVVGRDFLNGSEKHGYPGVRQGDYLLVRCIGDNRRMWKDTVTHFFEPVVTIRSTDKARDIFEGEDLVTRVTDPWKQVKTRDYKVGDLVHDIPILTTFSTNRFGTVGIGYVQRPEEEFEGLRWSDKRPLQLKKTWVKGGAKCVGSLIREAKIVSNTSVIVVDSEPDSEDSWYS